jgi:hypothetical protein
MAAPKIKTIETVQDLIGELMKLKNKTRPVFGYITTPEDETFELVPIEMIDDSISDRVDINFYTGDGE